MWPRRGPEGEPRVGGGACPPAGIGAAPAAGRDGAGPPQAAGRGWQMDDSPGRSPRTTDSSDERRERVCGVGVQATSIPPTPAPNNGAAERSEAGQPRKDRGGRGGRTAATPTAQPQRGWEGAPNSGEERRTPEHDRAPRGGRNPVCRTHVARSTSSNYSFGSGVNRLS